MGAQLWFHEALWHPEADTALTELQARFLAENYDLATLLPEHLKNAQQCVAIYKDEGDPYGLLEIYQEKVALLEKLLSKPIPESSAAQIDILRQISADSYQGIGNILDIEGISVSRQIGLAQRLNPQEIVRFTGAETPTLAEAQNSVGRINEELGRGECVCFPFYEEGREAGWYFVGNTID